MDSQEPQRHAPLAAATVVIVVAIVVSVIGSVYLRTASTSAAGILQAILGV